MYKATWGMIAIAGLGLTLTSCNSQPQSKTTASGLDPEKFVAEYQGKPTALYTLKNSNGMEVCVTNFGGRIVSIMAPDREGSMHDVVLGFDSVQAYFPENNQTDFGASIGRYANRLNQGRIVIEGDTIQLPQNNFGHCLHGGPSGWQYKVYDAKQLNDSTLTLTIDSPDGDNNFPGNVKAEVTYSLLSDNSIDIRYKATTDKPTVVNMTNHSYFNLNGNPEEPITNNILTINASRFTPVDSTYMTTGEILEVAGTPMDFTTAKEVGADITKVDYEQVKFGNGYDHNWVLDTNGDDTQVAATLYSPTTGIKLEVLTNEPGIQVYSGNFLDGTVTGKHGITYQQRSGICLETQKYPDSPNKPEWPSAYLNPGETYESHCIFRFSTAE
ncbi:MAG: aldose epimerase family protein [Bacteroidales bacterium]|nr:aldose epimerase family protein [Bacteroidales bacterium]